MSAHDIRETFKHLRARCPQDHEVLGALEAILLAQAETAANAGEVLRAVRDLLDPDPPISEARIRQISDYKVPDPDTDEFLREVLGGDAA